MTSEELLRPRFKVIADYPNSDYEIGLVLTQELPDYFSYFDLNKKWTCRLRYIEKFPHLFRKLEWYEEREEVDMPKYLKHTIDKKVWTYHEIKKWDMKYRIGLLDIEERSVCDLGVWSKEYNYVPISEEEYLKNTTND